MSLQQQPVEWRSLTRNDTTLLHSFTLSPEVDPDHLEAHLEREAAPGCGIEAHLVLTDVRRGSRLLRTPVEGPCNWQDLSASFEPSQRQLQVSISLLPPGSADKLAQAAAAAAAAAAAGQAPSVGSPEMPAAAVPASPPLSPQSSTCSLHSACSQLAAAGEEAEQRQPEAATQPGRQSEEAASGAEAAVQGLGVVGLSRPTSADAGGPITPHLSIDDDAGAHKAATEDSEPLLASPSPQLESSEDTLTSQAAVAPEGTADGDDAGAGDEQAQLAAGAGEAAGPSKKKKKKKKKKKVKAAGDVADGVAGAAAEEQGSEAEAEAEQEEEEEEKDRPGEQQAGAAATPEGAAEEQAAAQQAVEEESREAEVEEAPRIVTGHTELGAEVAHSALSGPTLRDALSKDRKRDSGGGEDQWLIKPANAWSMQGAEGQASFAAFGVFDGHGGRQVATFASNNLIKAVMAEVDASPIPLQEVPEVEGLGEEEAARWRLQATLMARLPQACTTAFKAVDADAQRRWPQRGGTTATLAVVCGWELLVANVGDSCAYLDTGSEVLQVSGTHRLEDSKSEVERCLAAGREVAPSTVEGKPTGPIRVWPGGLNMARTIGDAEAGDVVNAEPEVCQVTLPVSGGRLLIGSDGLWDAIHPKTAAHHCRDMTAPEAAHKLLALAIKADKLKDDVTVVVVDFLPTSGARLPPALALHRISSSLSAASAGSGKSQKGGEREVAHLSRVWHPLRDSQDWIAAGAERRAQVLAEQRLAEADAAAEAQRAVERQQDAFKQVLKKAALSGATAESLQAMEDRSSDLYKELATLRLDPQDVADGLKRAAQEAKEEQLKELTEGDWETVGDQPAEQEQDQEPHAPQAGPAAPQAASQAGHGGRGRGRGRGYSAAHGGECGGRGGRHGGYGRGEPQQQLGGREGRGRGRGRGQYGREQYDRGQYGGRYGPSGPAPAGIEHGSQAAPPPAPVGEEPTATTTANGGEAPATAAALAPASQAAATAASAHGSSSDAPAPATAVGAQRRVLPLPGGEQRTHVPGRGRPEGGRAGPGRGRGAAGRRPLANSAAGSATGRAGQAVPHQQQPHAEPQHQHQPQPQPQPRPSTAVVQPSSDSSQQRQAQPRQAAARPAAPPAVQPSGGQPQAQPQHQPHRQPQHPAQPQPQLRPAAAQAPPPAVHQQQAAAAGPMATYVPPAASATTAALYFRPPPPLHGHQHQQQYGAPPQQYYAAHPGQQQYAGHPQQQYYAAQPPQQYAPPGQQQYGAAPVQHHVHPGPHYAPPSHQQYAAVPPQHPGPRPQHPAPPSQQYTAPNGGRGGPAPPGAGQGGRGGPPAAIPGRGGGTTDGSRLPPPPPPQAAPHSARLVPQEVHQVRSPPAPEQLAPAHNPDGGGTVSASAAAGQAGTGDGGAARGMPVAGRGDALPHGGGRGSQSGYSGRGRGRGRGPGAPPSQQQSGGAPAVQQSQPLPSSRPAPQPRPPRSAAPPAAS